MKKDIDNQDGLIESERMKNRKLPVGYSIRKTYTGRISPWFIVYCGNRHVADCNTRRKAVDAAWSDVNE